MNSAKNVKAVFEKKPASGGLLHTIPNFQPGMYSLTGKAGFYSMLIFDGDIIRSMSAAAIAVARTRSTLPSTTDYSFSPPKVITPYQPVIRENYGFGLGNYEGDYTVPSMLSSEYLKRNQFDMRVDRWIPIATTGMVPDHVSLGHRYTSFFVVLAYYGSLSGRQNHDAYSLNSPTCLKAWSLTHGTRIPLNSDVGGLDYEDRLYYDGEYTYYAHITPPPDAASWMLQVDPIVDPYLANQECANFFFEATTSYPPILGDYGQLNVRVDFPAFGNYPKPPPLIWGQRITPANSVDSFGTPQSPTLIARGIQCRRLPATGCKFTIQYVPGRSSIELIENASTTKADYAKLLRGEYVVMNELSAVPNWFALRVKP